MHANMEEPIRGVEKMTKNASERVAEWKNLKKGMKEDFLPNLINLT